MVVLAGAVIGARAVIGNHVILLQGAIVSHDCRVGDFACVASGACLAGGIKMIHCSSHHAYELKPLSAPHDESKPLCLEDPCDYHRTKALGHRLIEGYVREKGLDAVIVNPGSMIGPQDFEPSLIGKALIDLYHRRIPMLMEVIADYVDARDYLAAHLTEVGVLVPADALVRTWPQPASRAAAPCRSS